ncbi:hypothetical protein SUDANB25_05799 [Streptomyces sp. SudanB25_2051]
MARRPPPAARRPPPAFSPRARPGPASPGARSRRPGPAPAPGPRRGGAGRPRVPLPYERTVLAGAAIREQLPTAPATARHRRAGPGVRRRRPPAGGDARAAARARDGRPRARRPGPGRAAGGEAIALTALRALRKSPTDVGPRSHRRPTTPPPGRVHQGGRRRPHPRGPPHCTGRRPHPRGTATPHGPTPAPAGDRHTARADARARGGPPHRTGRRPRPRGTATLHRPTPAPAGDRHTARVDARARGGPPHRTGRLRRGPSGPPGPLGRPAGAPPAAARNRTAAGTPATEWTRWCAPGAVVRTGNALPPLHPAWSPPSGSGHHVPGIHSTERGPPAGTTSWGSTWALPRRLTVSAYARGSRASSASLRTGRSAAPSER